MPLKTPFKSKATIPALLIALLAVLVILYAWRLWPFSSARQTTENAYVRGSVTVIAPKVDGYVAQVRVQDYMQVKAGQVLVELDARNYRQRLDQAQANLAAQQANLSNSTQAQRVREAAVANVDAQLKAAQANLARARPTCAAPKRWSATARCPSASATRPWPRCARPRPRWARPRPRAVRPTRTCVR